MGGRLVGSLEGLAFDFGRGLDGELGGHHVDRLDLVAGDLALDDGASGVEAEENGTLFVQAFDVVISLLLAVVEQDGGGSAGSLTDAGDDDRPDGLVAVFFVFVAHRKDLWL